MATANTVEKITYDAAGIAQFLDDISKHFNVEIVSKRQINEYVKLKNLPYPKFIFNKKFEEGFGKYRVAGTVSVSDIKEADEMTPVSVATVTPIVTQERVHSHKLAANITENLVPNKDKTYVPFGFYNDLKSIIKSKIFYPVYITGLSGNGKTVMVEQICAATGREMVRVNITKETDETDLIGSYELIDGNTVRREGPVVTAMRKGAILLLDETDYGSERLLCLQPILEGKPFLDKKTGEVISPTEGFNVIATANTKGKGSEDGRFIGANVLNEAFLERFAITVEQEYPTAVVEKQILERNFSALQIEDEQFIDTLVSWAEQIRKTYEDGGTEEIISTRRLVHIAKAFSIFNNRMKAIEMCLNRFDKETKTVFLDLFEKLDSQNQIIPVHNVSPDDLKFDSDAVKANVGGQPLPNSPAPITQPTNPVPPSFKKAATKTYKTSSSAHQLPAFANVSNLTKVVHKFGEKVLVNYDAANDDWIVESHSHQTRISNTAVNSGNKEKTEGEWLELLVSANAAKKNGSIPLDYRPIN
jgi:MoxR-like ATPase